MAKPPNPPPVSDEKVRVLLERYKCPVPFHEVRTRFLGNIATPVMSASPIKIVQGLWGGELPTFDSVDEANELLGALMMGFWNRLARHQNRNAPFRLMRVEVKPTPEGLSALALMRRQELDGFVEGLFGDEEVLALPERANRSLTLLAEMRALFAGVAEFASTNSGREEDLKITLNHLRTVTGHAEREIHAIMIACTLARRQSLALISATKPTLH